MSREWLIPGGNYFKELTNIDYLTPNDGYVNEDFSIDINATNLLHSNSIENIVLTQKYILNINDLTNGQTSDNILLTSGLYLVIQNSDHVNNIDNIILTHKYILGINNLDHILSLDTIGLDRETFVKYSMMLIF